MRFRIHRYVAALFKLFCVYFFYTYNLFSNRNYFFLLDIRIDPVQKKDIQPTVSFRFASESVQPIS